MEVINRAVHLQPQRTIHIGEENKEKREKEGMGGGAEQGGREGQIMHIWENIN